MYGSWFCNEYMKGLDAFVNFIEKHMLDNVGGNLCYPCKHCKNKKKYRTDDVLMSHLIEHGFMEDYRCWNKYGEEGLNEAEMRNSYLEREVPTGVEEEHDDVNEADILGFTNDDIEFQVYNIKEMIHNIKRHDDDDRYNNDKLAKYKKMIENSNKPSYHGRATDDMRLFMMVKLFSVEDEQHME
jgi:hypothetical protein